MTGGVKLKSKRKVSKPKFDIHLNDYTFCTPAKFEASLFHILFFGYGSTDYTLDLSIPSTYPNVLDFRLFWVCIQYEKNMIPII